MEGLKIWEISFAGLLHDIGKIMQPAVELPRDYKERNAQIYLPFNKQENKFTHFHALYTVYFIENYLNNIASAFDKITLNQGSHRDSFINLAGKHHTPETPLQWIIAEADRLSSGFDREEFLRGKEIPVTEVYNTRLLSTFERLLRKDKNFEKVEDFEWEYPLAPIAAKNIFPIKRNENKKGREEYKKLWESFLKELRKIKWEKLELWVRAFDSLLMIYTSQVPAARVGKVIPDVSLYDHSKTTASIAGALYLFHKKTNTLEESFIKKEKEKKFLLISGDFYGIQEFIFRGGGEERHHRAKILRGRSFMVSLLCDLCAEFICEELQLSPFQIFFSAAGKFHLLAPNVDETKEKLEEIKEKITLWFKENFYLESGIGVVSSPLAPEDFKGKRFVEFWKKHLEQVEEAKYKRFNLLKFGGKIDEYLDKFKTDEKPVCTLCGKRPTEIKKGYYACKICEDQIIIGTNLVKNKFLAILKNEKGELKVPFFGTYQLKFLKKLEEHRAEKGLIKVINYIIEKDGNAPCGAVFLPLNGHVPVYTKEDNQDERIFCGGMSEEKKLELIESIKDGVPKTFYHIAKKGLKVEGEIAYGIEALAVLKADVDNLGAIFACGLPVNLFTISRLSTISRKLHEFFAVYLPYALETEKNGKFKEVYTLFAGGDDLFLIGPWNIMPELALYLHKRFKEFVCFNPELHFSAGISLHKPNIPVEHFARDGETALEKAKGEGKNRICMFGRAVKWDKFEKLLEIKHEFEKMVKHGISKSFFYKLNEFIEMAEKLKEYLKERKIPIEALSYARWRALVAYFVWRNVSEKDSKEKPEVFIETIVDLIDKFGGDLYIPLWSLLYEKREKRC